ncbi:Potassium-transporting ATPase potassium-binding subunit [Periweissella ghanensis]|uniref:Potassium-transporting ATPase potassium-binding subunit n=1 Tax=Periweissella ghanensis TaxID=467997 RepID=A0ABM8ZC36_9LACO|nr:Potassium-transporting ATPase potassium-binding subunit [Periweissella ghanensis]
MIWVRDVVIIAIICLLAIPIGNYIYRVLNGERTWLTRVLQPLERLIYRGLGYHEGQPTAMTAKTYVGAVISISSLSFIVVFGLQLLQKWLPLNPNHVGNVKWDLAFNTAVSFVTNTNWQAYSGETTMSYLTQIIALTTQNFLSPAVGVAALLVIMRGFKHTHATTVGNF